MNCQESRKALDDWMAEVARQDRLPLELQAHVQQCPKCSEWYLELRELDSLMAAHAIEREPSPFFWTRLEARLQASARRQQPGWAGSWLSTFPAIVMSWTERRRVIAGLCMLALLLSTILIHQQAGYFQRRQLLGQIDKQWNELSIMPGSENPFQLEIGTTPDGLENPFPIIPETRSEENPFITLKS